MTETSIAIDPQRLARRTDPLTSHQAAQHAQKFAPKQHARIQEALEMIGHPAGAHEIAEIAGLTQVQVCKRLPEMQRAGLVEPTGETRPTGWGGSERLWRLA